MASWLAWVITSAVSSGALVVSVLTYRLVRRANAVGWSITVEERSKPGVHPADSHLIIRRASGPAARKVTVEMENVLLITGGSNRDRVDPGGVIDVRFARVLATSGPPAVTVAWDGRFGRRRTWHSGI